MDERSRTNNSFIMEQQVFDIEADKLLATQEDDKRAFWEDRLELCNRRQPENTEYGDAAYNELMKYV